MFKFSIEFNPIPLVEIIECVTEVTKFLNKTIELGEQVHEFVSEELMKNSNM